MKATQIVYASFAVAAPVILVLAACGASGPAPGTPEAFYVDLGCAKCHGNEREGLRSGPPLGGRRAWSSTSEIRRRSWRPHRGSSTWPKNTPS